LNIADVLATSPVDPERHLNQTASNCTTLHRSLPSRRRLRDGGGLLLVDGYHRVAPALQEGQETIEAEVRSGSRQDALEYPAAVGATQRGRQSAAAIAAAAKKEWEQGLEEFRQER
jgi:hypothetical protein